MKIEFLSRARSDVRALDRATALRILEALDHWSRTQAGDVLALQGEFRGLYRLRVGDYRVLFAKTAEGVGVKRVLHRSAAYSVH